MFKSRWSRFAAASLAFCFVVAILNACEPKPDNGTGPTPVLSGQPKTALPMPPLKGGPSLAQMGWDSDDGKHSTISSYQDHVLVLDFYATWCAPCRDSVPHLVDLEKRYGPQGLVVIGLNVGGPDDRAEVPGFAREFKIHYQLGFPEKALSDLLMADSDAIPQTFVFDRKGRLVQRYVGFGYSTADELEETIKAALKS